MPAANRSELERRSPDHRRLVDAARRVVIRVRRQEREPKPMELRELIQSARSCLPDEANEYLPPRERRKPMGWSRAFAYLLIVAISLGIAWALLFPGSLPVDVTGLGLPLP